ncbi:M23 family metallopeptidase [Cytobacillus firmus]|uniref:M23 family metallopeptidase n=1 Tax=Cytobacillus firmus TaxID=1399 RepID=UPI0036C22B79
MIVRITSKFGAVDAVHKTPHTGIDLAVPEGTPLHAIGEGVIDRVFDGSSAIGKGLSIRFEDGTRAIYGHMSDVSVKLGEQVNNGSIIGLSGNTGASTGPHLHFGMKDAAGSWLDPSPVVDRMLANGFIGNGVGEIPKFSVWEWLGEKAAEVTVGGIVDIASDLALSFPFIAVVSFGVYSLIAMLSKGAARWGVLATILYGICVIK